MAGVFPTGASKTTHFEFVWGKVAHVKTQSVYFVVAGSSALRMPIAQAALGRGLWLSCQSSWVSGRHHNNMWINSSYSVIAFFFSLRHSANVLSAPVRRDPANPCSRSPRPKGRGRKIPVYRRNAHGRGIAGKRGRRSFLAIPVTAPPGGFSVLHANKNQ